MHARTHMHTLTHCPLLSPKACDHAVVDTEEARTKILHMGKMFQMYSTREFTNGCDVWLAGICRYLNGAYATLAGRILSLLAEVLCTV